MALQYFAFDISGGGTGSTTIFVQGELAAIRVAKTGANSPVVTIAETQGITQTVLNAVTVSAATNYYPRVAVQDNAAAARLYAAAGTAVTDRYQLNGNITISCTGGSSAGTVTGFVQTYD